MKICYLADAGSIHVQKRIGFFAQNDENEIHLISFNNQNFSRKVILHYIEPQVKTPFFLNYLINIPKIRKIVHQIRPDLLHSFHSTSYGFVGACCRFRPFVVSCLGSDILISPWKSVLHKWLTMYTIKKADAITSVSSQITSRLLALGVTQEKIQTFSFGADLNMFYPSGIQADRDALLSIRSLKPVYNIKMLLQAAANLRTDITPFKLTIAGDGPEKEKLMKLAERLGIGAFVEFVGVVPHAQVPEYLRKSSIYLSTSFSDGASISLMEAMACGCFPIVTDIPANRDWITDGVNGFLVTVGDFKLLARKIEHAMENSELRKAAAEKNINIVRQKGSWDANMKKLLSVYESLTETQHPFGTANAK